MLIGAYRSKVTSGNRTALPKKFRDELGEQFIVTNGYEGCLIVVSLTQWKKILEEAASGPFVSETVRDTSRFLIGGAHEVEVDKQGRFVIPANLLQYSEIKDEVTFLGLNRWVEMWDTKTWHKHKKYIENRSGEIAKELASLSL